MSNFIERLLDRSPEERKAVTYGAAGTITGILAIVWITVVVAGGGTGEQIIAEEEAETSVAASFRAFSNEFSSQAQESIDSIQTLNEQINSSFGSTQEAAQAGWNLENELETGAYRGASGGKASAEGAVYVNEEGSGNSASPGEMQGEIEAGGDGGSESPFQATAPYN